METNPDQNGKYITIESLSAAEDIAHEDVDVPEWGGRVKLRQLSAGEMSKFFEDHFVFGADGAELKDRTFLIKIVAATLCDSDGNRMFENVAKGYEVLEKRSFRVVNRLANIALELNTLSDEAIEAEKKG